MEGPTHAIKKRRDAIKHGRKKVREVSSESIAFSGISQGTHITIDNQKYWYNGYTTN